MTLRLYLILMSIGALICWLAWFFVIGSVEPEQAGFFGFLFFYSSLFLALAGTFSIFGFLIKKVILKNDQIVFHHVKSTFRQGMLMAGIIILGLILLQIKLLTWWNGILLILLFALVEGIIFTNRKYNNR
ncbi:MAG: hypothetical protein UT67_C0007G0015 [Candidatus Magasanikbacteria bacterium GW2011_GWA2_40_10]|uniref:Uncharacterized protein n=1 Tax=Candidatus Magasanikbacteria bacterium GW2011_GWA2_40_10 TaxID=1619037 RepID=A0A0G0QBR1_9BACT|nr:MAG: hypothetical protein UT67_C0007G0015 [Candidatus Magasanikbacteria bacterium GW2011_GWA2_40_10]